MPDDLAVLGIEIPTSGISPADQALTKLSTTAATAERSTKSLTEATKGLGSAATTAAAATDKAATSARRMTQYDDAAMSVYRATQALKENAAAATARAASMKAEETSVQAHYQTMLSAAQRYSADVAKTVDRVKISDAYQASTVAARSYTAEVNRMTAATTALASAQSRVVGGGSGGNAGMTAQQRTMLGYQLNDVFTQMSMGTNPALIAAQQGPQITQVFGGLKGTLSRIPTGALVGGGIAAGAAAGLYALNTLAEINDALQEQGRRWTTLLGVSTDAKSMYIDIAKVA